MIGKKLQSIMIEKSLTQKQLAQKMSVTPQAVSLWINDITDPDLEKFKLLTKVLEVSADELLED